MPRPGFEPATPRYDTNRLAREPNALRTVAGSNPGRGTEIIFLCYCLSGTVPYTCCMISNLFSVPASIISHFLNLIHFKPGSLYHVLSLLYVQCLFAEMTLSLTARQFKNVVSGPTVSRGSATARVRAIEGLTI